MPTPPAGLDELAVGEVPFTPQAARNADTPSAPAPVPAALSIWRRDMRRCVMPRQMDGSITGSPDSGRGLC